MGGRPTPRAADGVGPLDMRKLTTNRTHADVDAEIRGDEVATSVSTDEQQDEKEDRRSISGVHEKGDIGPPGRCCDHSGGPPYANPLPFL